MTPALTPLDWHRFTALLALYRAEGIAPSVRELAAAWGVNPTRAKLKLDQFEAAGLIRRMHARARAMEITRHLLPVPDREGNAVFLPEPQRSALRCTVPQTDSCSRQPTTWHGRAARR